MARLVFMLWVLLWPLVVALEAAVYERLLGRVYPVAARSFSALVSIVVWVYVGWLLY